MTDFNFDYGIPFSTFIGFYKENEEKLFMSPEQTYHKNCKNIELWKQRIKDPKTIEICEEIGSKTYNSDDLNSSKSNNLIHEYCPKTIEEKKQQQLVYSIFADVFADNLKHIPFTLMMKKIENISNEIIDLNNTKNYDKIYIYIDGEINKSNTWIALLFSKFLQKNTNFVSKCNVINKNQRRELKNNYIKTYNESTIEEHKKILIIHMDDMSYSGSQIDGDLYGIDNILTRKINENFFYNNIDYYLGISYISNIAINTIKDSKKRNIKLFKNTVKVKKFVELINDYIRINENKLIKEYNLKKEDIDNIINKVLEVCYPSTELFQLGFKSFQCHEVITPIYFDHKVADWLSTFQKLIYFGSYPTTQKCDFLPLINGIHLNEELEIEKMYKKFHCHILIQDMEETFPSTYTGEKKYRTFYKNIKYVSNGINLDNNNNIVDEIVKSQQQDGGTKKRKSKKIKKSKKIRKSRKLRKSKK